MTSRTYAVGTPGAPGTPGTPGSSGLSIAAADYRPGVCNIGREEIGRRRRAGHVALAATLAFLAVLVVIGAPAPARALVGLPAAAAASGYLQAWLKFCAGFASRGVFNFGRLGETHDVEDEEAHRRDRARANQILVTSVAVGVVVGVAAFVLPL
jgi:hypothetical protein